MFRSIHRRIGLLAMIAAVSLGTTSCGFWNGGPPNIIVITMDTFRADRMAMYGGQGLTPTLDALAQKGTVFSHAVVSSGTTYPSHATMFTGLYPRQHAVRSNFSRLPDDVPTLAEKLTAAGYDTGAFVSFKGMLVHGNLGKGFAAVSDTEQPKEMFRHGDETTQLALDWLDSRVEGDEPVFLWYHNFDAHTPLRVTDYSRPKLEQIGYEGPWSDGASIPEVTTIQEEIIRSGLLQDAITALYDGEVINADLAVQLLMDGLEERGILDNAVLMLVADHGEALGENGWFGHGATLWETVIHTPMVYVDFRKPRHRVVDTTVGTVDMMATLLDVVGVEPGPNQGRSLLPAIRGEELNASEYVVEIEMRKEENRPAWYDVDRLALYYDDFKFEYVFGEGRLFDLEADPDAVAPLDSSGEGEAIIATYLEGLAQEFLAEGNFAGDSSLDDDTINQLRSLGYVQ